MAVLTEPYEPLKHSPGKDTLEVRSWKTQDAGPQTHPFLHSLGVHGGREPLCIPQCNPQSTIEFSLPEKTLEQRSKQVLLPDIEITHIWNCPQA